MTRLLVRRLLFFLPTLLVLSVLIFVMAEVMPGDLGRLILGPYASPETVAALNHQLGVDRPLPVQYVAWLGGFVTGQWGESAILGQPVFSVTMERLWNSTQLAAVAIVLLVPISLFFGVLAGLRRDTALDRSISVSSLSLTVIPEFVSGVVLIILLAIAIPVFPVTALAPEGSGIATRVHYLFLPAVCLMFVELGYIARMARSGVVDVLDMPYVRTAVLKGLSRRQIVQRHVLRNALIPTVTVIGAQVGWLVGGLVVIETLFGYPGIGKLMADSARFHDIRVLEATVLVVGVIYVICNLTADLIVALLSPQVRYRQ